MEIPKPPSPTAPPRPPVNGLACRIRTAGREAATIEFAVAGLSVKDIIVCGHSHCGVMKGLLEPPRARDFPALTQWLTHAESTRRNASRNPASCAEKHSSTRSIEPRSLFWGAGIAAGGCDERSGGVKLEHPDHARDM